MNYEILSIDEYQRRADRRYYEAMDEYRTGKRTQCPMRSMFMYVNAHGEPRRNGYVVVWGTTRSRWFRTRREAIQTAEGEDKFTATDK